ncbi:SDR family NAD(P)-dependent oxidoreductase [Microbacterium sp. NPDC077663]|uniref:SDR family NAD(P)-dependent oxidoreductase n=1 Tax=Microbacterium sp. NPDC077663 TaxID=3364189 RepID=UPI0037C5AC36
MTLADKVAIVTGASKGLGAAIADALAAGGARVVVNYASSKEAAERVVARITASGGHAIAVRGDVSVETDADALIAAAIAEYGRLDILVNNSGVYEYADLADVTAASFHRVFDIDVLGLIQVTRAASAHLGHGGSIVNMSSLASTMNPPGALVYTAAKHAVDGITAQLANELAPRGIRVNGVAPGLVDTEGTRAAGYFDDSTEGFAGETDLGTPGRPGDIAAIVAFLASDAAVWVTGQTLVANGAQPGS